jgi:hypothetical protein
MAAPASAPWLLLVLSLIEPPTAPTAAPRAPPRTTERPPAIADWDVVLAVVA